MIGADCFQRTPRSAGLIWACSAVLVMSLSGCATLGAWERALDHCGFTGWERNNEKLPIGSGLKCPATKPGESADNAECKFNETVEANFSLFNIVKYEGKFHVVGQANYHLRALDHAHEPCPPTITDCPKQCAPSYVAAKARGAWNLRVKAGDDTDIGRKLENDINIRYAKELQSTDVSIILRKPDGGDQRCRGSDGSLASVFEAYEKALQLPVPRPPGLPPDK